MKDIIELLRLLNKLDIQLQTLKNDIERLPKELSEKQVQPRVLTGSIERAKAEIIRLKMDADNLELECRQRTAHSAGLGRQSYGAAVVARPL